MQYQEWISNIKNLTPNDFQKAEGEAETLVRRDIGDKPSRKDFHREQEPFDIMFLLQMIVFFFGLLISIFKGVGYVGIQANSTFENYEQISYGLTISKNLFVFVLQFSYVFLAEFGMIANMMRWTKKVKTTELGNKRILKFIDYHFFLALLGMSVILLVNLSSGMHLLLALMPALIVIGLGYDFETFFSKITIEVERVTREYNSYTKEWNDINLEPEKHPDYQNYLMRSIWKLLAVRNKLQYEDISGDWKYLAVQRELENVNWAKYGQLKERLAEQSNVTVESMSNKLPIQILRESMDLWKKGDDPIIKVENYSVDMNKLIFKNHSSGVTRKSKSIGGLRKIVTTIVKGMGG